MIEFDPDIQVPPHRVRRMLAALIAGLSPDAIGAEENLEGYVRSPTHGLGVTEGDLT